MYDVFQCQTSFSENAFNVGECNLKLLFDCIAMKLPFRVGMHLPRHKNQTIYLVCT